MQRTSTKIQIVIAISPLRHLHVTCKLDIVIVQGLDTATTQPTPCHVAIPLPVPGDDVISRSSLVTITISSPLGPDLR